MDIPLQPGYISPSAVMPVPGEVSSCNVGSTAAQEWMHSIQLINTSMSMNRVG